MNEQEFNDLKEKVRVLQIHFRDLDEKIRITEVVSRTSMEKVGFFINKFNKLNNSGG